VSAGWEASSSESNIGPTAVAWSARVIKPSWHHLQASRRSDEVPSGRGACACCRTQTAKRMIYYYFGRKEQLFEAALEQAYSEIRAAEQDVRLDHLDTLAAIPGPKTGGHL